MSFLDKLIHILPEVVGPTQKRLSFKDKMKWTLTILVIFFVLGLIPLYGLGSNALRQFEFLSIILGASFGSVISLGIGPIVTASIVLQLLAGTGLFKIDTSTPEGREKFQGIQKLLGIFFIIFEAAVYVLMGGLSPAAALKGTPAFASFQIILIVQLFAGGMLILFMDDVVNKWGFGSGLSLFIVAGVAQQIFVRALNPLPSPTNPDIASGAIPALFQSLSGGDPATAALMIAAIVSTIVVFVISVYGQAMKVEIPLSFGRVRGYGMRWPLSFFYTSNIPVILVAALLANIQLWVNLVTKNPNHWLVQFVRPPNIIKAIITQGFAGISGTVWLSTLIYVMLMVVGSVVFAYFWMQTSGMDAKSQAKQILSYGLQVPGFRRDPRVLESLLNRYILPLTLMGGAAVGLLAALADLTGALSRGTGILLSVMIVYKLYEEIAKQHMEDAHPLFRKFMSK